MLIAVNSVYSYIAAWGDVADRAIEPTIYIPSQSLNLKTRHVLIWYLSWIAYPEEKQND